MKRLYQLLLRAGGTLVLIAFLTIPVVLHASASGQSTMAITPEADAYVNSSYPSTNYGTGTILRVDDSPYVYSFLRFSVSGLGGLPITGAILRIYANTSSSPGLTPKAVSSNSWGETTMAALAITSLRSLPVPPRRPEGLPPPSSTRTSRCCAQLSTSTACPH